MDYTEYPHLVNICNVDCRGVTGSGPVGARMLCGGSHPGPKDKTLGCADRQLDGVGIGFKKKNEFRESRSTCNEGGKIRLSFSVGILEWGSLILG